MRAAMTVLSILYVAGLCLLLWIAKRNRSLYAAGKGLCSLMFVLAGVLCWVWGGRQGRAFFVLLLVGLVLCAFGDVFLGVANRTAHKVSKKPFVLGAFSFLLAHGVFCAMLFSQNGPRWQDLIAPAILLVVLYMLEKRDKVRLKKMRPLGYIYTAFVAVMAGKAAAFFIGPATSGEVMLAAGAVLFLISDVILLFLYFGTNRGNRFLRPANLLTYYVGVYLMACSAWWI